jgi:hypothetical protein
MSTSSEQGHNCCTAERKQLMAEMRKCDYCTTSYEEYQQCYEEAARESGERSRSCLAAAS